MNYCFDNEAKNRLINKAKTRQIVQKLEYCQSQFKVLPDLGILGH